MASLRSFLLLSWGSSPAPPPQAKFMLLSIPEHLSSKLTAERRERHNIQVLALGTWLQHHVERQTSIPEDSV